MPVFVLRRRQMWRVVALVAALLGTTSAFAPTRRVASPALWRATPPRLGRLAAEPQAMARRKRAPAGSRAVLTRTDAGSLDVVLPARGLSLEDAPTGAFAVAWLSTIALWTRGALAASPVMALASLPFWLVGAQLVGRIAVAPLTRAHLTIGRYAWRLELDGAGSATVGGSTDDLDGATLAVAADDGGGSTLCLVEGIRRHALRVPLAPVEGEWLAGEINDWLREAREGPDPGD